MEYLEFELPIKELEDQLQKCQVIGDESNVDVTEACKQIQNKLEITKKEIYKNLTPWQRVQLSRHPNRPYTLDYINAIFKDSFLELHRRIVFTSSNYYSSCVPIYIKVSNILCIGIIHNRNESCSIINCMP